MRFFGNQQAFGQRMTACFQLVYFYFEQSGIQHDAVSDYVYFITLKNSGRNGSKYVFLIVKLERMTCVGAALKATNHIVLRCQYIHYFSFSFIAPLEA